MAFFPIELEGEPYGIGYKRGWLFRYHIRSIAETRLSKIPEKEEKIQLAKYIEKVLKDNYPELVEELRGMADGSGIGYEEMLLINAWWDKPWWCSNVALTETSLGPILGSSLDIGYPPDVTMMHYKPKQGYSFVTVGQVDLIGSARAMNEKGLCVGGSSVKATDTGKGFPRYTLLRVAIQYCATVDEVLELFKRFREGLYNPGNYIFLDRNGDAVVIEQTNTGFTVRRPEKGGIACTNHYESPEAQKYQYTGYDWLWVIRNSEERYRNFMDFIKTADRSKPIESMMMVIRSHGPGGICQHGGEHQLCATVGFIMLPGQREFHVSQPPGFYCKSKFIKYTVFE